MQNYREDYMNITSAKYIKDDMSDKIVIKAIIDGLELFISTNPDNRHYAEIMKQVAEGTLTIEDAD